MKVTVNFVWMAAASTALSVSISLLELVDGTGELFPPLKVATGLALQIAKIVKVREAIPFLRV